MLTNIRKKRAPLHVKYHADCQVKQNVKEQVTILTLQNKAHVPVNEKFLPVSIFCA
jgi:hypothetical protein